MRLLFFPQAFEDFIKTVLFPWDKADRRVLLFFSLRYPSSLLPSLLPCFECFVYFFFFSLIVTPRFRQGSVFLFERLDIPSLFFTIGKRVFSYWEDGVILSFFSTPGPCEIYGFFFRVRLIKDFSHFHPLPPHTEQLVFF